VPEETEATLRGGWVHSGDLGYRDPDGFIYLAGRKKHMIIRGGENIYPAEVEKVVLDHPGVREAVVIGLPDEKWGEIVAAVVVPVPGKTIDPAALIAHCKTALASYRCPERIEVRESLPYNAAGKVMRHVLQDELSGAGSA